MVQNFSIPTNSRNGLTLTHFKLRVLLVNNEKATLTTYDLAVRCALL